MTQEYAHKCSRCGFCCLITPCPIALERLPGAKENEPCQALDIGGYDEAECVLFSAYQRETTDENLRALCRKCFGVGEGCCISAVAIGSKSLRTEAFSSLDPAEKRSMAVTLYRKRVGEYRRPVIELAEVGDDEVPFADPDGLLDPEEINTPDIGE